MTALPSPFTSLRHVVDTGSTNADLAADGQAGDVLVTDHQTAGRGRFDRRWEEPPGSSLLCSVRLEVTAVPGTRRGWIPLTAGLALAEAVGARLPGAVVGLKWPNDVFVDGRKVAGILAELAGDAVVIGMGCNLTQSAAELFSPDAASLATAGATDTDRDALLHDLLAGLGRRWAALAEHTGHAGLVAEYRTRCVTLGRTVRVELGDGALVGEAVDVDTSGALVVAGEDGRRRTVSAGDVVHLR